jgi:hypothetical protein
MRSGVSSDLQLGDQCLTLDWLLLPLGTISELTWMHIQITGMTRI